MPTIYDIDFNKQSNALIPKSKRKAKYLALFRAFMVCFNILHQRFFGLYANGFNGPKWSSVTAYTKGNTVRYNRSVYECLVANTNKVPTDTQYWTKILDNYIGARERVTYNSQKMIFEYILNKYFEVPPGPQIYIENNDTSPPAFVMGQSSETSSSMTNDSYYSSTYMGQNFFVQPYSFTIFVPSAIFSAIDTNPVYAEKLVRQIAERYRIAGKLYNILTY